MVLVSNTEVTIRFDWKFSIFGYSHSTINKLISENDSNYILPSNALHNLIFYEAQMLQHTEHIDT